MKLIAIAALAALGSLAEDGKVTMKQGEPRSAMKPSGREALRIYIDPQTGELREAPASSNVQRSAARTAGPTVVTGKDGSSSAVLGPEHRVYSIATIDADGKTKVSEAKPVRKSKAVRK